MISRRGNLILITNYKEKALLKFDGRFDPKFGSGYFSPTLSADGKKVAYQYMAGFLENGSGIYEMDMKSKSKKELIGAGYYQPKYSPDGLYLLLGHNNHRTENNTWINDIYILDIQSKELEKIGQGDEYLWINKR